MLRQDGQERVHGVSNRFRLYRDLPRRYDAWDIDSQTFDRELNEERSCEAIVTAVSGARAAVRFITRLSSSVIEQTVSLDANGRRLDFDTRVDWHEQHRLLKVSFDTGIDAETASHQIQFGFIDRPAHRSRRYDADRFEVCNHAYTALYDSTHGAAVLNDCKYGVSAEDGVISLSLLRAPTYPDANADRGINSFRYSYYCWNGSFCESGILEQTEALNIRPVTVSGACVLPGALTVSSPDITLESVKHAEDGSGDMIVRLCESMRGTVTAKVSLPFCCAGA